MQSNSPYTQKSSQIFNQTPKKNFKSLQLEPINSPGLHCFKKPDYYYQQSNPQNHFICNNNDIQIQNILSESVSLKQQENNQDDPHKGFYFNFEDTKVLPYDPKDPIEVRIHKWLDSVNVFMADPADLEHKYFEKQRKLIISNELNNSSRSTNSPCFNSNSKNFNFSNSSGLNRHKKSSFSAKSDNSENKYLKTSQDSIKQDQDKNNNEEEQKDKENKKQVQKIQQSRRISLFKNKQYQIDMVESSPQQQPQKNLNIYQQQKNLILLNIRSHIPPENNKDIIASAPKKQSNCYKKKAKISLFLDVDYSPTKKRSNSVHDKEKDEQQLQIKKEGLCLQFKGSSMMKKRLNLIKQQQQKDQQQSQSQQSTQLIA